MTCPCGREPDPGIKPEGGCRCADEKSADPIEEIAHHLYACGPYGEFFCFTDRGARAITDAHSMDVYRRIVRDVLDAVGAR